MQRSQSLLSVLFFCLLFSFAVFGQPPDPLQLKEDWWQYFNSDNPQFDSHYQEFKIYLKQLSNRLNQQEQEKELIASIERIQEAWDRLLLLKRRPQTPLPEPYSLSNQYSIQEAVNVYRLLRLKLTESKDIQENKKEKNLLFAAAEDKFAKTQSQYDRLPENEELLRLEEGLLLIYLYLDMELLKEEVDYLNTEESINERLVSRLNGELKHALSHLYSSDEQIQLLLKEAQTAQEKWQESKRFLRAQDAANQGLLRATIVETLAHQYYLFKWIEAQLALLLYNPDELNLIELHESLNGWNQQLDQFQHQMQQWSLSNQKQLQRSLQTLSLLQTNRTEEAPNTTIQAQEKMIAEAQSIALLLQQLEFENDDARFVLRQLDSHLTTALGGGVKWWGYLTSSIRRWYFSVKDWTNQTWFHINTIPITPLSLLRFAVILALTYWFSRFLMRVMNSLSQKRKAIQKSMMYRISRLVHYFILTLGLILALSSLGFDFSNFALIAGALGVGLGFGLQAIFNNFISGIILLFESQIKVGDFIELESGARGEIREINVRSTVIRTNDGVDILVPNSQLLTTRVINWTLSDPFRRIRIPFSVAHGVDKDFIASIIVEAAKQVPLSLKRGNKPDPVVYLTKIGENGLDFELAVWVDEKASTRNRVSTSDYLWAIESTLKAHNIPLPQIQKEIYIQKESGTSGLTES
jgi:potassium-dependent mechanosensitive channel